MCCRSIGRMPSVLAALLMSVAWTVAAGAEEPRLTVTTNLALWLKADAGVTTAPGTNAVVAWAGQSAGDPGEANDATAPSEAARPQRVDNGPNQQPLIRFDGRDDRLDFKLPINGLRQLTIFLVAANTAPQDPTWAAHHHGAMGWVHSGGWGTVGLGPFQHCVAARFGTAMPSGAVLWRRPASIGPALSVTTARKHGTAHALFVDGKPVWSATLTTPDVRNTSQDGSVGCLYHANPQIDFYHGDVAEILVYTTSLPDAARRAVEQYLLDRWIDR